MNKLNIPIRDIEPDYTQSIFPTIEKRLGRKLSEEENRWFARTGGMYKEWFYNMVYDETHPVEDIEQWITFRRSPLFKRRPKSKGWFRTIIDMLFK